jgi:hypothetical protein
VWEVYSRARQKENGVLMVLDAVALPLYARALPLQALTRRSRKAT